ncbi:ABC transporter permease [Halobacteria archaeon AArc-dxtr1]|nr:ABC transporter permease [Halobacteria archaeon AArc-dxtr1]
MARDDGADGFDADGGSRIARWRGLVAISIARLWNRTTGTRSGRLVASVGAVALTIALLVVVTGVALGLADAGAVDDTDADVTIAPEDGNVLASVDGVEGPRLGETSDRSADIGSQEGVSHVSPVLVEPVRIEAAGDDEPRTVLLVGVVPDEESRTVGGLPTDELSSGESALEAGDLTGEIVLSAVAADRLGAAPGDDLVAADSPEVAGAGAPTVTTTAVESADDETPIALVHLDDLQQLSGAADGQLADRILVWGDEDAATAAADDAYPDATVESSASADPSALFGDGLAFATSALAFVVSVAICASFVATTAAMTVNEDRKTLAVLTSVGFPTRSRLAFVASSTLATTLCGAVVGTAIGAVGIYGLNAAAAATIAPGAIAQFHPVFVPYALAVALVSGLVAIPYPLTVAARTNVLQEVGR